MTVLDFFRGEPVRLGMKAGFLGAVVYLALRYLGGCPNEDCERRTARNIVLRRGRDCVSLDSYKDRNVSVYTGG